MSLVIPRVLFQQSEYKGSVHAVEATKPQPNNEKEANPRDYVENASLIASTRVVESLYSVISRVSLQNANGFLLNTCAKRTSDLCYSCDFTTPKERKKATCNSSGMKHVSQKNPPKRTNCSLA